MKRKKVEPTVAEDIAEIRRKLDSVYELTAWSVRAEQRFKVGNRVQFNTFADRRLITERISVRKGKVVGVDGMTISVLLDGRKHPKGYHHMFFDRIK